MTECKNYFRFFSMLKQMNSYISRTLFYTGKPKDEEEPSVSSIPAPPSTISAPPLPAADVGMRLAEPDLSMIMEKSYFMEDSQSPANQQPPVPADIPEEPVEEQEGKVKAFLFVV